MAFNGIGNYIQDGFAPKESLRDKDIGRFEGLDPLSINCIKNISTNRCVQEQYFVVSAIRYLLNGS
jgi:hypothetical protein